MEIRAAAFFTLAVAASGCGWDGIFLTPRGFEPTDPPRVVLAAEAEPGARVVVVGRSGNTVASAEAPEAGEVEIRLPPSEDGLNLRIAARKGTRVTKAVVALAPKGEVTGAGVLDVASTARAQLAIYEITQEAGSSFAAVPPPALRGLLRAMDAPTPELVAFTQVVAEVLAAASSDADLEAPAPFDAEGFALSEAFVAASRLDGAILERYRAALGAAAQGYSLEIRCDPTRLNAMFTVDASGRARDGNGAPQLIRQPSKEGRLYLGFTADETSPIAGETIPPRLTPNDPAYPMKDDGQDGDEVAGDGVYTVVVPLPRGARIIYKYTNGAAGEGFTGTEEWPGNARIIEVEDVLTGRPDGEPDCLIVRRDSFGDEATNKNFVNLNAVAKRRGGTVAYDTDLGGAEAPAGKGGVRLGGLSRDDLRSGGALTPVGVPEARENGVCTVCPAPLILDPDDATPPKLLSAERTSTSVVRLRFSEPISDEDARDPSHFQYLDDAGRSVPIRSSRPSGSEVVLEIAPSHPTTPAKVRARDLRDVSAAGNELGEGLVPARADRTAPKVVSVRALGLLDVDPTSRVDDPTVGEVVELVLDETPEASSAADPARFAIDGLEVHAAALVEGAPAPTVRLLTAPQVKGAEYVLRVSGLRDPAGNALVQEARFDAFALYRVTFGVVPGFAFADSTGAVRGLPRGEKLYLTGTPLAAARDLSGRDISVTRRGAVRTDVTGWPELEMKPGSRAHEGQPVHEIALLLPRGSWAWKAAHGVAGEQARPPPTLEKVYKVLVTANDASGVAVDPAAMRAANGVDYRGARLSETGEDPPRRGVLFKREAPDEVCEVVNQDTVCPFIVPGTWRDLVLDQGGKTRDYDDGIIALPPHRPSLPDFSAPKLLDARALDSFTILLSFDEAVSGELSGLELLRADGGPGLPVAAIRTEAVRPHQVLVDVRDGKRLADGQVYTLRYRGASDALGHVDRAWKTATVLAPEAMIARRPLVDASPPAITGVDATDLTELVVHFDERVDPASLSASSFAVAQGSSGAALAVSAFELLPDRASVRLTTDRQSILERYRLTARGVADVADPPNTLTATTVSFTGFGERTPPRVARVRAIGPTQVLVRFDEALDPLSAADGSRYRIDGLSIAGAAFAGDPARKSLAFNPRLAPAVRDVVVLTTSPMTAGAGYQLLVDGVLDLSGNAGTATVAFAGVDRAPVVDVVLEYVVSDAIKVAGRVPSRAIGAAKLAESREGVFVLGARQMEDGTPVLGQSGPVNDALLGFPPEGSPLEGIEPRLRDNGQAPDAAGGDGVFTILVPGVPLGTTMIWKAFAPFTTTYRDRNPGDPLAAFADAVPGPSVFGDGQEFPGNENGAVILDEGARPGVVRVRCLFGDEVTFKKNTGRPAYLWVAGDR